MNTKLLSFAGLVTGLALQLCPTAMANTMAVSSGTLNELIPDNNLNGVASSLTMSTLPQALTSVSVTLDIAGDPYAYNGDYYAYLQYGPDLLVLLNHIDTPPTYGSPGDGINVTLSDGSPNIATAPYTAGSPLTGTYAAQGGSLNGTFGGLNPNGKWTLFVADESPGGVGELVSWSVTVTTVPDNTSTLMLLGLGLGGLGLCSVRRMRSATVSAK